MLSPCSKLVRLLLVSAILAPCNNLHGKEKLPAEQVSSGVAQPTVAEQQKLASSSSESPKSSLEQFDYPANHHVWAKFPIGSWREVEITTETFDEAGALVGRSVTTQKEILKAMAEDSYVLEIQATVDVSGKQIVGPVNTRILRLLTDQSGSIFSTTRLEDEKILVDDQPLDCQVWDVFYDEEARNLRDRVYYSPEQFPHVIRRETFEVSEEHPDDTPAADITSVIARHLPQSFDDHILPCVCIKTTRDREKGSMQVLTMISPGIPGGEVQSWSTDFSAEARPNRWSVLKLLNYGVNPAASEPVVSQ